VIAKQGRKTIVGKVSGSGDNARPRLLIFIVAYQAERTIKSVLARIPHSLAHEYHTEVLVIDDASTDETFHRGREALRECEFPFPLTVLFNPVNQGYGGNQKIGYHFAQKRGFDFVALLHGDGQYAPECLPELLIPLRDGAADACFGSRMMHRGGALKGDMPLYKYVGNKLLSWFENRMLRTEFTEFHSGYRAYSVAALGTIPFDLNTNDFHFDTEIIVQFVISGLRIVEKPIPTYYGDEICHVNGMKYAWNVTCAVIKARLQELGVFYDRKFDCAAGAANQHYQLKLGYQSPHTMALEMVPPGSRVLDLGCAGGYMAAIIKAQKRCRVVGVDVYPLPPDVVLDAFHQHDLNEGLPALDMRDFDVVLMLDVIEHLSHPEAFIQKLREAMKLTPTIKIIVSTGNIGFVIARLMLLFGQFNYGKRGLLDLTHSRLFTFASLRRLFEQNGFHTLESRGVPAPYPLAVGGRLGRFLLRANQVLIRVSKRMFSYQMFIVAQPRPSLEYLLETAETQSALRETGHESSAER
jgi:2-polyprenyl-3-methyl-5-hydroxy-6-metoxy-1,4-benzoquinol methylase/glycosyltransferase involved in cell wall biosynthesis